MEQGIINQDLKEVSLVQRLTVTLAFAIALTIIVMAGIFYLYTINTVEKNFNSNIEQNLNYLSDAMIPVLWNLDRDTGTKILKAAFNKDFISYLKLSDDQNKTFILIGNPKTPQKTTKVRQIKYENIPIGWLEIHFSSDTKYKYSSRIFWFCFSTWLITIVCIRYIANFLIHRFFRGPLSDFTLLAESYNQRTENISIKPTNFIEFRPIEKVVRNLADDVLEQFDCLQKSESRYKSIFKNLLDIYVETNREGTILEISPSCKKHMGYKREELLGVSFSKFYANSNIREKVHNALQSNHILNDFEVALVHKKGQIVPFSITSRTIRDKDGNFIKLISMLRFIGERKEIEKKHKRLFTAVEHAAESIIITDAQGIIQYVNPAFEAITGYTKAEALGNNPRILKSGIHESHFYKSMWQTLTTGNVWQGQIQNRNKNGDLYYEYASITPIKDKDGIIVSYVGVKRDITHELEVEQRLLQAQKMEAIGTLSGGIAHDFNNILTAIIGYTEIALQEVEEGSAIDKDLHQVLTASNRAKDLVAQILAFARQSGKEVRPVRLDYTIKEVFQMLRSSIPSTINITQSIESDSRILGNDTQLHQVVMNLCTNAAHAMEENGGVLHVGLKDIGIDEKLKKSTGLMPGNYVELIISDTGVGIGSDIIRLIFNPYFTTKAQGEGTGMGLAVAQGIIESYEGKITVQSEMGKGTTFTIYLPVSEQMADGNRKDVSELPAGTGNILIADDEVTIAEMFTKALTNLGYSVTMRTSSVEALELFRSKPNEFDILITDMTMPKMTGEQLAIEVLKIRPDLPVIICTGYSKRLSKERVRQIGVKSLIYKPVINSELANAVYQVLK